MAFDGAIRSCVKYAKAKGGVLRCAGFEEGRKFPKCPGKGLKGGGRSQNYLRPGKNCSTAGGKTAKRARRAKK